MRNLATYEGVIRECIHALKYENNQGLAELFSGWLASLVKEAGWVIDMVTAVPLSPRRYKERGYNQSERIARPLAMRLGISYNPFAIKRIRDTVSQVGLSAEARRRNVENAFKALPELVEGKRVLLFDDVMTTGSTLEACSKALKESGVEAVHCLTIGRFIHRNSVSFSNLHPV
jgi:ComF family protein